MLGCLPAAVYTALEWSPFALRGFRSELTIAQFIQVGANVLYTAALGTFSSYVYQRIIGALLATWWTARRSLPDPRWAAKIIDYENAFMWVLWPLNAALTAALLSRSGLLPALLGPAVRASGIPLEWLYLAILALASGGLCAMRDRRARLCVRSSNY